MTGFLQGRQKVRTAKMRAKWRGVKLLNQKERGEGSGERESDARGEKMIT